MWSVRLRNVRRQVLFGRVSPFQEQLSQTRVVAFAIPSDFYGKELDPRHYSKNTMHFKTYKTDQAILVEIKKVAHTK